MFNINSNIKYISYLSKMIFVINEKFINIFKNIIYKYIKSITIEKKNFDIFIKIFIYKIDDEEFILNIDLIN